MLQTKDAAVRAALAAKVAAGPSSTSAHCTVNQSQSQLASDLVSLAPTAMSSVTGPGSHKFHGSGAGKADGTGSMEGVILGKIPGLGNQQSSKNRGDGLSSGGFSSPIRVLSAPSEAGGGSILSVAASSSSINGNGSLRHRQDRPQTASVLHSMRLSFVDIGSKVLGEEFKERQRISDLRRDFVEEMRTLSKLRHPCITTVSTHPGLYL